MNTAYRGTPAQESRLKRRAHELCEFFASTGRLPGYATGDPEEMGLCLFLISTVRPRYQNGTLRADIVRLLEPIPGALRPALPVENPQKRPSSPREAAFERWLVRAEIYTTRHGYRPTASGDNALYQWLNRARRKAEAGDLDQGTTARVMALMEFPDLRTYRYWAIHGKPTPEEGRKRYFTD